MTADLATRLRAAATSGDMPLGQAFDAVAVADEIERLRGALALAVGELSTHAQYAVYSPDQLLEQFMQEAGRG